MSYLGQEPGARRLPAAIGVGALHGVLGAVLLTGLAVNMGPEPPPPPIVVRLEPPKAVPPEPLPEPVTSEQEIVIVMRPPDVPFEEEVAGPAPLPEPVQRPALPPGPGAGEAAGPALPPVPPVRVAARAKPGLVGVGPDDYPEISRRLGEEGRTVIRVAIGADGTVRECSVTA